MAFIPSPAGISPPAAVAEDNVDTLPVDIAKEPVPAEPEVAPSPRKTANEKRKAYHGREVEEEAFTASEAEDRATCVYDDVRQERFEVSSMSTIGS